MKFSKQREFIHKALTECSDHPTADQLYFSLREDNPNLSLGTVYRNLNMLAKMGVITKIAMPLGPDRFDGNQKPHCHMVCTSCFNLFDCSFELFASFQEHIFQTEGFLIDPPGLVITGLCQNCIRAEKES